MRDGRGGPCGEPWQGATPPSASAGVDRRLPRARRLTESRLFREAFDGGLCRHGRTMVLWFRPGPGASLRLGVVASKRIFPRAVDRARAKRLLREAYRLNRTRLHGKYDVVLVARRAILDAASGAIGRELLNLSRDAGARRPETK